MTYQNELLDDKQPYSIYRYSNEGPYRQYIWSHDQLQDALDQVGIVPCDMTNHIRILHGHMSISGLDATTDQSEIIFRIIFSNLDENFTTMKIQTSGGSGDADILVGSILPVTRSNSIYSSRIKGSSEVLYVEKKRIDEGYLVLLPKR
jgi:hypothetical protein